MEWFKDFLQSVGIDAIWAIFLIAIATAFGLVFLIWSGLSWMQRRLNNYPLAKQRTGSMLLLSALCRIKPWLVFGVIFLSVLTQWPVLGADIPRYMQALVGVLVVLQIGLIIDGIIKPVFVYSSIGRASSVASIGLFLSRLVLWIILVLIVLDNFGIKITALVAGLGVGGIAIALAVKNVLEDIFSSLTIALDKPFSVGDSLRIGDFTGNVERIGIKTTHIRSVDGEMLIFSNADLLQSRIRNFGRMRERRVLFTIGITYEVTAREIENACKIIKEVINSHEKARLDRVHFLNFNASSLDIEVVYWVKAPDFLTHADLRQSINLGIFQKFDEAGLEFAYPTTRTIGGGSDKGDTDVGKK